MGMFDWVKFETPCPLCGEMASGFQSKSGSCTLELISPMEAGHFYAGCKKCGMWIRCEYVPPSGPGKIVVEAVKDYWDDSVETKEMKVVEIPWDSDADKKNNPKELPSS